MSERITKQHLNAQVDGLNTLLCTGDFSLYAAYGGYRLSCNGSDPIRSGLVSKRKLSDLISAYTAGVHLGMNS